MKIKQQIASRIRTAAALLAATWLGAAVGNATPILFTGAYEENFDSLSSSLGNIPGSSTIGVQANAGISGWDFTKASGSGSNVYVYINNGTSGGMHGLWSNGETDAALGSLASGSYVMAFGAAFTNDTSGTLTEIAISFTAEFWRAATTSNTLTFAYGFSDETTTDFNYLTSASLIEFTDLNIVSPAAASAGALNGNDSANQASFSATIDGIFWEAGQTLYLRWTDADDAGTDATIAVDNFSLIAVPEPSGAVLLLGGASLWTFLRRRPTMA